MDYIQWELDRQKKALAVLLYGKSYVATEETQNAQQTDNDKKALGPGQVDSVDFARESEETIEVQGGNAAGGFYEEQREPLKERGRAGMSRAISKKSGRADGGTTEVRYTRSVMANEFTAETSVDIRGVSRAIQRDARRYDGGFSIY